MIFIGLFFPSLLSLKIILRRNEKIRDNKINTAVHYGIYVLINTLITQVLITYVLNIVDVNESALTSFPFFIKYGVISIIIAFLIPYMEEIIQKSFGGSIRITKKSENSSYEEE